MDKDIMKLNILVVDDEASIREGSARILTRMGHEVLTASRGEEGLEVIKNGKIPELWDGKAAERITGIIFDKLK